MVDKVKRATADLFVAGSLALIISATILFVQDVRIRFADPDDWMVINAVAIPDHAVGEDPMIVYDRTVLKEFRAEWVVDLYRIEGEAARNVCNGSGVGEYHPNEVIGEVRLYAWYMDASCNLVPGVYIAKTVWRAREGIVIRNTSNVFEVSESG